MAEALINAKLEGISADSAGVNPTGKVNPNAQQVLVEHSVWNDSYHSKEIDTLRDNIYDLVVTVCDNAEENCPLFPVQTKHIHIGFADPDGKNMSAFHECYEQIENILLSEVENILHNV